MRDLKNSTGRIGNSFFQWRRTSCCVLPSHHLYLFTLKWVIKRLHPNRKDWRHYFAKCMHKGVKSPNPTKKCCLRWCIGDCMAHIRPKNGRSLQDQKAGELKVFSFIFSPKLTINRSQAWFNWKAWIRCEFKFFFSVFELVFDWLNKKVRWEGKCVARQTMDSVTIGYYTSKSAMFPQEYFVLSNSQ